MRLSRYEIVSYELRIMSEKKGILKEKSFVFALRTIKLYQYLSHDKKEFVLSKQVLRSRTSIGAMICEAQNAESTADFIHKLAVAQRNVMRVFIG
jgi:four helix bundle protein